MNTAVAIVAATAPNSFLAGVIAYLKSPILPGGFLFAITNGDGYAVWDSVPVPFTGTLQLAGAAAPYGPNANGEPVNIPAQNNVTIRVGPSLSNPQDVQLPACSPFKQPFVPAPRTYKGCMGRTIPGLPRYAGDYDTAPSLLFSWLLHRVSADWQQMALRVFKAAGDEDFLLSWPDFESQDPIAFGQQITTVKNAGFRPIVFLSNRSGPRDLAGLKTAIAPVLPILKSCGVPRVCVGWELDSWIDPGDDTTNPPRPSVLEPFIDWLASEITWGAFLYVHFDQGVGSWQPNGELFAKFWNWAVKKLRGILHQKVMTQTDQEYQTGEGGIRDILLHFNGGSGCTADSGDGTPFDLIAFEVDLEDFSEGVISEAEMHRRAVVGLATPPTVGPTGIVQVMGSGCGLV